jgi:spermidine synthase
MDLNNSTSPVALGRHLLIEYRACDEKRLNKVVEMEKCMRKAAEVMQATIIHSSFHHFSPYGVSGVVVIQESHLTIHTWPEYQYAAVDFFTCGPLAQPENAVAFLKKELQAENFEVREIPRGILNEIGQIHKNLDELRQQIAPFHSGNRQVWFTDRDENVAISLRHRGDLLFQKESPIQMVEVYDTFEYGRMLALDQVIMCTEKDEHGYHEMLVHVPAQTASTLRRCLVIGGGDGGAARELLRYPSVEEVVLVEIDEVVVEAVRKHMPFLSDALSHSKLTLVIDDGAEYLKQAPDHSFDLVIMDAPDPVGPAECLFTKSAYQHAHRVLKENGLFVTQSESPYYRANVLKACVHRLRDIFGTDQVFTYLSFIPTYTSGMWSFTIASKGQQHPLSDFDPVKTQQFSQNHSLKYYNEAIHTAAFALPNFVRDLLR